MEQWLEEHIESQRVDWGAGECQMNVPSIAFDSIYVSYHAALHAGIGLSLHHLCDMAVLFGHVKDLPKELYDRRFFYPVSVFAQLCNHYLGIQVAVEKENHINDEIMREILRSPYQATIPYKNAIQSCIYKIKRTLHCLRLMKSLLKPSLSEMVSPLLEIIFKQPGRLIR